MYLCLESSSFQMKYMCPVTPFLIFFLGFLKCMIKKQKQKQRQISREEIEVVSQVASQISYFVLLTPIFYCSFLKWNENLDKKQ